MDKKVQEILKRPYSRNVISQEDGTFFAEIIEFPSCFAQGNTREEALNMLDDVAASWIGIALAQNKNIPPPLDIETSGRFVVRLPKEVHRKAISYARKNGVSLNQFVSSAVSAAIGAYDLSTALKTQTLNSLMLPTVNLGLFFFPPEASRKFQTVLTVDPGPDMSIGSQTEEVNA